MNANDYTPDYNPAQPPIRACFHCVHVVYPNSPIAQLKTGAVYEQHCGSYEVIGKGGPMPCREARAISGPCGPEARFLKLKGEL